MYESIYCNGARVNGCSVTNLLVQSQKVQYGKRPNFCLSCQLNKFEFTLSLLKYYPRIHHFDPWMYLTWCADSLKEINVFVLLLEYCSKHFDTFLKLSENILRMSKWVSWNDT